jgi:hypothetical protein
VEANIEGEGFVSRNWVMIDSDRPLYAGVVYGRLPNELKGDP